jgi:hypothetical protein
VTEHPTAAWTAQQLVDAFPDDSAPSYLLRDRDTVYGAAFRHRVNGLGIREVLTAPSRPWQNPFAERLIGSIRRECLDHGIVLGERHLRRILTAYFAYYQRTRTHLALGEDAPDGRSIEPPEVDPVLSIHEVGGCTTATSGARPEAVAALRDSRTDRSPSPLVARPPSCQLLCFRSSLDSPNALLADEVVAEGSPEPTQPRITRRLANRQRFRLLLQRLHQARYGTL